MSWVLREIVSYSWDSFFFSFKKTRLLIKVDDEYIIKIIAMTIHSFKFWQTFFLLRQQSGRVKRHAYSYVFLLRPPLPKARSRGGRQFFFYISKNAFFQFSNWQKVIEEWYDQFQKWCEDVRHHTFWKKTIGYHGMMLFSIEILQTCVFLQNINQFHEFRGTPNGTQMVPKILSSQNMMSEVFKTVSTILITYLDQFLWSSTILSFLMDFDPIFKENFLENRIKIQQKW